MKITSRQAFSFSEIGRKDNQEDRLFPQSQTTPYGWSCFVLCDGMGGHDNGEVASEAVSSALGQWLLTNTSSEDVIGRDVFNEALAAAYDALDAKDNGAQKKMGTTMTCLYLNAGGALMCHIGDSRIYHVRPSLYDKSTGRTGIIFQTSDHSLVNDLLKSGEIDEEQARNYPHKNIITRAMQPNLERRPAADVFMDTDVQAGDYFFMCCDGVLEQLTNQRLAEILSDMTTSDQEKLALIKEECDGKTKDNYTCWLIPIDSVSGAAEMPADGEQVAEIEEEPVVELEEEDVTVECEETQPCEEDSVPGYLPEEPRRAHRSRSRTPKKSSMIIIAISAVAVLLLAAVMFLGVSLHNAKKDKAAAKPKTEVVKEEERTQAPADSLKKVTETEDTKMSLLKRIRKRK